MRILCSLFALIVSIVSAGSGTECASCQIVVALFERLAMRFSTNVTTATKTFCTDLAPKFDLGDALCDLLTGVVADVIEKDYEAQLPPQYTCLHTIKLCANYSTCDLYTVWPPPKEAPSHHSQDNNSKEQPATLPGPGGWEEFGVTHKLDAQSMSSLRNFFNFFALGVGVDNEESRHRLNQMVRFYRDQKAADGPIDNLVNHLPFEDKDDDRFSAWETLRGGDWRGKDCDDRNANVYPGRMTSVLSPDVDHNCNGIYGTDSDGVSFEDKFCKDTGNLGVIAIGDSATAHFRVPPDWLNAATMDKTTYSQLIPLAENELDWPECSSNTGHRNQSFCPQSELPITSMYLKMFERNRCNHRDFQNIGVNGARTTNTAPPKGSVVSMKERNVTDQPALVVYAMIGNDVCSGHHDFDHMTKPDEFEKEVLATLDFLDARLQKGSHLVFGGLVDGRVLYDIMHDLQHPVGTTYKDVYNFLNCVEVSPCWGWMNSNETVRNMTSQHAYTLNQVYPKIIKESAGKFKNFDMFYIDTYSILPTVIDQWVKDGHQAKDLIEPTDGFHPSQTTNSLLAENFWANLTKNFPQAQGKINPHNQEIVKRFGDQGGYWSRTVQGLVRLWENLQLLKEQTFPPYCLYVHI